VPQWWPISQDWEQDGAMMMGVDDDAVEMEDEG
jgi:hypothetical protein